MPKIQEALVEWVSAHPRLMWLLAFVLLLPPVFFLAPIPIDETRYLAVAWNMHVSGTWLLPFLDGSAYAHKPPLLFWLINGIWAVTGVSVWSARLLAVLLLLASLPLLAAIGRWFAVSREIIRAAQWVWLGTAIVAGFAGAVMFDILLALSTLVAWLATLRLSAARGWKASLCLGVALAAGILIKGPVALLVGGLPALLAPWWSVEVRTRLGSYYLSLLLALALAAALALAWAIPAALAGGSAYAHAIFLSQTVGRVASSFAHGRPPWWYLPLLPVMLLPWSLCLERVGAWRTHTESRLCPLDRFVIASFVPAFAVFSLISGKQPHYLLPVLPALALLVGTQLVAGRWRVSARRLGLILLAIGLALGGCLYYQAASPTGSGLYLCATVIVLLGVLLLAMRRVRSLPVSLTTCAMLLTVMLCKLAFVLTLGDRYDVSAASRRIAEAQRAGRPLLVAGPQHGLFTFAGRLTAPIPSMGEALEILAWAKTHPDGWVISSDSPHYYAAAPFYRQLYLDLGRDLSIWSAGDVVEEFSGQSGY